MLQLKTPFRDETAAQVHFVQYKRQTFISIISSVRKASLIIRYWFSISFPSTFKCLGLEGIRERDWMFYNSSDSRSAVTAGKAVLWHVLASRSWAGGGEAAFGDRRTLQKFSNAGLLWKSIPVLPKSLHYVTALKSIVLKPHQLQGEENTCLCFAEQQQTIG